MPVIQIHDLEYKAYSWGDGSDNLPGIHPTDDPMATKATRNTEKVANFMSTILDRRGDHIGTIKCVGPTRDREQVSFVRILVLCISVVAENKLFILYWYICFASLEWRNACWFPPCNQAIYGQQLLDRDRPLGQYISLAENLGIVAHEMFHGVTCEITTELNRKGESGSLHESYSDIFAIIILNHGNTDISKWNWELGRPFGQNEHPIRNFANPTLYEQPDHWEGYREAKGVHYNCGIHNKAAYNLMNATYDYAPNRYLFDSVTLSRLFYLSLGKLGYRNTFIDSRDKLLLSAATIFRKNEKLKTRAETAIKRAFADVGITL